MIDKIKKNDKYKIQWLFDDLRVRCKGRATKQSMEGESSEDACKRILKESFNLTEEEAQKRMDESVDDTWYVLLDEYDLGEFFVDHNDVLYRIVEQEVTEIKDSVHLLFNDNGDILFDIEFCPTPDVVCPVTILNDYFYEIEMATK